MGLYGRIVLPRLMDLAMRSAVATSERRALVPRATGRVIEVGIGSGLNLPHYGPGVTRVIGVDPSRDAWRLARSRRGRAGVRADYVCAQAEHLPLDAGSADTVVMTWTLCSVADPAAALAEVRRVLAPGGRFVFVEHGRAPDHRVQRWQQRITPVWQRLAGGCHLDRDIRHLVEAAGLRLEVLEASYAVGPRVFAYLSRGVATARRSP